VAAIGQLGDDPAEHCVTEELEPLVARLVADLGAPAAMGERAAQQRGIGELVAQVEPELGEIGFGPGRNGQLAFTRSYT